MTAKEIFDGVFSLAASKNSIFHNKLCFLICSFLVLRRPFFPDLGVFAIVSPVESLCVTLRSFFAQKALKLNQIEKQ